MDGCEDISFSHFSCEKQISSHPSEAVPGFSDGTTTSMTNFFPKYFYPKYFYYITYSLSQRESSIVRSCPLLSFIGDHGASPPLSVIRKNKMSVGVIAAKRISASSWGQCASFQSSSDKKSTWHHFKNSPFAFVPRRAQPMHIE